MQIRSGICGVATLYFPKEDIFSNIDTYIRYLDRFYIVDNTPEPDKQIHARLLERYPQAELYALGKNTGVAKALNIGMKKGTSAGYQWLLTMDQDSFFEPAQSERFFSSVSGLGDRNISILSPSHKPMEHSDGLCVFEDKAVVMTSGNLVHLGSAASIGLFNEKLFIDSVDHDYCLRSLQQGFSVLQATNCYLTHRVGEAYKGEMFWGVKRKSFSIHSPKRMYFIVRNGLYINRMYKLVSPAFIEKHRKHVIDKIIKVLKYSDHRTEYIHFIGKALFHYATNRFGNPVNL
ncbi:MAG: glycosyltransferase [Chlorobium sp.]|jgi:rhamnosyltransferase|uniref:glycosyltransferase n=1 Tax=Chlorobium sp. TaxID=1095 RepID=UPI0025C3530E|nr:glycosyltransferase [Chlorobium sp.]MCF8216977.1 glycosyltransferase [Chlorobium sp.]MCF8271807.1 glycosyltransferase [Chlorobium sp.]MCF8288194.1 glycosyltransferase [Chlorobium sp.]MCF8291557.1 glycosyltransferase [Chlorobium sp.]MCF8385877.1 glycosyltransferase [Chlorobium sp.]